LTRAISRTRTVDDIYGAALDALAQGLGVARASILLFDPDGVMRFKAYRGLSETYRRAVEGHTPWTPDTPNPQPILIADVGRDASLESYWAIIAAEGIAAMAFIPLLSHERVIGKFMLYYPAPHELSDDDLHLAALIAAQVAFALERTRAEENARRSESRLLFALDAAAMGTWDWDLPAQTVRWSTNLERIHGLPSGTFDGTFDSYQREIHPDDRERVLASIQRAIDTDTTLDVEYRIVGPDGTVRWVEGKGQVEYEDGRPVRMSGVCLMVTRRKEAELARLAAAEEASRSKDDFLAILSHELRTPLNAVLGWVRLLEGGELTADRGRHALEVISRNATLQARLIEDILDLSRIIAGKLEIERRPLLVPPLVETAISGVLPAAEGRGLQLVRVISRDLPPIEADAKRLQQVLGNVLSNAVKFTPDGGRIDVVCRLDGSTIVIEVRDSGIGIDSAFLPFIFHRFRQADSRANRRHGGLGLGLAIAHHLVEQHGGRIGVESAGIGRGTTVRIELPTGMTAPSLPARDETHAGHRGRPLDGLAVLVIDDQPDARELLGVLLEQLGARVHRCSSAGDALAVCGRERCDLLVSDIAMPGVDGYELLGRLRSLGVGVPAVAVSAYARPEDRAMALAAGYGGYCVKPVDPRELLREVESVLRAV
jgi:PAS domain S-box-containing protein